MAAFALPYRPVPTGGTDVKRTRVLTSRLFILTSEL